MAIALSLGLGVASASALTLGVNWSGDRNLDASEMFQIGQSGTDTYREPLQPEVNNDPLVQAAAENEITVHAEVSTGAGTTLPAGAERTSFIQGVEAEVRRYGYNGEFWAEHPGVPYKPITTWEVWNEPNAKEESKGFGPVSYAQFLNEVANGIQAASQSRAGRGTEVLSGGLLLWGNESAYVKAVKYLETAYASFGTNANVTGIAIHPYELDPATFRPGYNRIEAFRYAVGGLHAKLVELAESLKSPQKSLWITEAGWPAEGPFSVGASEQANLLRGSINYAKNNEAALNLRDFLWYNVRDRSGASTWDDFCGLRDHNGTNRASWSAFQEETGGPNVVPSPMVIGNLQTSGDFYAKQGSLTSAWTVESTAVQAIALASDPNHGPLIGNLQTSGDFYAKQGSLTSAWTGESTGVKAIALASDPVNGPLIGILQNNGNLYVKQGGLGAAWTLETGEVQEFALASDPVHGPLIGALHTNGDFYVKEGSLNAAWTGESSGVKAIALASDPVNGPLIGILQTSGNLYVKQGSPIAAWTWESSFVKAIALASDPVNGPLIGNLQTSGDFYVKEGSLVSAWTGESTGVKAIALASDPVNGPLIGILQTSGNLYVKQGSPIAAWTWESSSVKAIALAG